jgi:hypothetical protein
MKWMVVGPSRVLAALLLVSACGGGETSGDGSAGGTAGSAGGGTVTYPKACSDIYDPAKVPVFELEIAPDQMTQLERDCEDEVKAWRPATFRYGAETASVMVRLKGNWSWRCEKKQFLISFNEIDPNGRFHGVRKIVLDAPWYDPAALAERLGFSFMRRHGTFWSCANHAKLMLNGSYYGLYSNVERLDKEYLQRHFPDAEAEGNLYDGGEELTTNETLNDVSRRDALFAAADDFATVDAMVDLDAAIRVWAGSAMLPDPDSYWAGVEINWYLYDHPTRGFIWFPYDMDLTMRQGEMNSQESSVDIRALPEFVQADPLTYEHPDWGREELFRTVLENPTGCSRFLDELRRARSAYDVALMTNEIDTWAAQIADGVAQDPHKLYSNQDHLDAIAMLKSFIPARAAFVDGWLQSATCPVTRWPR